MGTYRLHALLSGRSVQKSRKRNRKKQTNPIWADAVTQEHYWELCLLDIFCYFYLECPLSDHHPDPCSGLVRTQRGESSQPRIQALEVLVPWASTLQNFHTSKHPSPCFALGVLFTFLLFEGGSPHFAISCTWTITSLKAALCCCARRKNVNLNKPPSQWYLKTDCRISSHFCKALFKNNSYIFIFQLVNREFF